MSGSFGWRLVLVSARGRTLPSLIWLSVTWVGSNAMSIWPVSRSVMTAEAPLYGIG